MRKLASLLVVVSSCAFVVFGLTAPMAVARVFAQANTGTATVNVSFQAAADHNGASVTAYRLKVDGVPLTDYPPSVAVNGLVTLTVPGLSAGVRVLVLCAVYPAPTGEQCDSTQTLTMTVTAQAPTPVDAVVGAWSAYTYTAWSACTNGIQSRSGVRTRSVITPAQNGGSTPPLSESTVESQVCVVPPATFTRIRVDAGGPGYTDPTGVKWDADRNFTGGTPDTVTAAIANTVDDKLYQSERFGQTMSYAFPVPNGSYVVVLKMAEGYWTAAGRRIFSVAIEGTPVLTDFDIFAAAGGQFRALDRSFPVTVSDGSINIAFTTKVDNASITAIEVVEGGPAPAPVDWVLSDWSAWVPGPWSACVAPGTQSRTETRTRTVITAATNGSLTPALSETQTVSQACTVPVAIDAVVSAWSLASAGPWSACIAPAGSAVGSQTRTETWTRTVITPAENGGLTPNLSETRAATQSCSAPVVWPPAPGPQVRLPAATCPLNWTVPAGTPDGVAAGWSFRIQRKLSSSSTWTNHGTASATTPFSRSATVNAGQWDLQVVATKGGASTPYPLGSAACQ